MEEQSIPPLPQIQNRRQPSARPPQQRRTLHRLVALLVVCALIGSMAVVLYAMHPTTEAGSSTTTPVPTPTGMTWGKTLDNRPVDSLFSNVSSIAWAPTSQRVANLTYNGVQIWDATTGAHQTIARVSADQFGILENMAWSPNGKWIAVGAEAGIGIVNVQTSEVDHFYPIRSLTTGLSVPHVSPLSFLLPASGGGGSSVTGLTWSPTSSQLAITDHSAQTGENTFSIIDAQTGSLVHAFTRLAGKVITVASWSPDGTYLAASVSSADLHAPSETMVQVWDTSTYTMVFEQGLSANSASPMIAGEFAWQPQSDVLLFAKGNSSHLRYGREATTIQLWNVVQKKLLKQYALDNNGIFAWSPDGHAFATGSYAQQSVAEQVAVITVQSGQQIYAYHQQDQVLNIAWSPNRKYIASSGATGVNVWIAP